MLDSQLDPRAWLSTQPASQYSIPRAPGTDSMRSATLRTNSTWPSGEMGISRISSGNGFAGLGQLFSNFHVSYLVPILMYGCTYEVGKLISAIMIFLPHVAARACMDSFSPASV